MEGKAREQNSMRKGTQRRKRKITEANEACLVFCSETGFRKHLSGREETLTVAMVLV